MIQDIYLYERRKEKNSFHDSQFTFYSGTELEIYKVPYKWN